MLGRPAGKLGHKRPQTLEAGAEAVVLGRDLHAPGEQVLHRMVAAVVAELQLVDLGARGLGHHLVPEADAEQRNLPQQFLGLAVGLPHRLRVARAVGEERAVGIHRQHLFGRGVPGHHRKLAARGHQAVQDGALHAAVIDDHFEAGLDGSGKGEAMGDGQVRGGVGVGAVARYANDLVLAHQRRALAHLREQRGDIGVLGGNDGPLGAMVADMAHERAGVDALDGHDALARQVVAEALLAAPAGGRGAHVAHHERPQSRVLSLGVVGAHAVVAHLRIGEHHDLPRIGGIGDDFQIAFHRGVEADLPEGLAGRPAGGADEHRAVLQYEHRRRSRRLRGGRPHLFRNLAQRFRPFRDSLAFASCASPAPRRASLRLRTHVKARPVPQRRPQKSAPALDGGARKHTR